MVAGFCCNTAVCGDGVLNLLSEGHWRGSRKRFNQSINQPLWSSSLSSSSSSSSSSASSSVVSLAQVSEIFFNTNTNCENRTGVLCLNAGSSLRARNCRMSAARLAQVARRTRLDARWVFLNDGSLSGGILRPMHAWQLERGQKV